jgi:hypothetical protein
LPELDPLLGLNDTSNTGFKANGKQKNDHATPGRRYQPIEQLLQKGMLLVIEFLVNPMNSY